jgi:hypothetical protein
VTQMRLRVALIACAVAFAVRAGAAERVVFCAVRSGACVHPKETLGTSPAGGVWAIVDDQVFHAAAPTGGVPPRILYFSREEYVSAVAGLTAAERAQAVSRRLQVVSANAPAVIFGLLHDDLFALATATAGVADARLEPILDPGIVIAGGANRFASVAPGELVRQLRESPVKLLVELPAGSGAEGYRKEAGELARVEAEIRNVATAPASPFASPERAYFLARVPPPAQRDPSFVDQPWYGWRGGTVKLLRPDEANQNPSKDSQPRLLYFGRIPFLRDVTALTDAQMNRRLRARLAQAPERELAEMIATMAFDHSVLTRQYAEAMEVHKAASWLPHWRQVVSLDAQNLQLALQASDPRASHDRDRRLTTLRADVDFASVVLHAPPGTSYDGSRIDQIAIAVNHLPN